MAVHPKKTKDVLVEVLMDVCGCDKVDIESGNRNDIFVLWRGSQSVKCVIGDLSAVRRLDGHTLSFMKQKVDKAFSELVAA